MSNQHSKQSIHGVDPPAGLRNLTRVTESQIKRTGSNPVPATAKPLGFSPPGQGTTGPSAPAPAQSTNPNSAESVG